MFRLFLLTLLLTSGGAAFGEIPFRNARVIFSEGRGHVAFLGGSITQMDGYRPMVMNYLKEKFPQTEFNFTPAGLGSTCSTSGAFRFQNHVLSKGPVDLLFVEFAVNDDQDAGHAERECIRGMEGVVRRLRLANPKADIAMIYFINPSMLKTLQAGKTPLTIAAHAKVAERYGVTVIPLAQQVAREIKAGSYTWKDFGGTHPKPYGNKICAEIIKAIFDKTLATPNPGKTKAYTLPPPLDPGSYFAGRFVDSSKMTLGDGWLWTEPNWKAKKGGFRSDYGNRKLLHTEKPGAELSGTFNGTAVGAFMLAGPDSGIIEYKIDDQPYRSKPTFHRFSRGLHYPRTVMLETDLKPGPHTLTIRLAKEDKPTAIRILHLVENDLPL